MIPGGGTCVNGGGWSPTRSREGWQGKKLRPPHRHHAQNPVFPFGVLGAMLRL